MNYYIDQDKLVIAGGLGAETQQEQGHNGDSLEFNKNDFIRSGRRGRRTARDNEDELIMAGGLGKETEQEPDNDEDELMMAGGLGEETEQEPDNERGGVRPHSSALFGQRGEDDAFMAPTQRTEENGDEDTTDSELWFDQ